MPPGTTIYDDSVGANNNNNSRNSIHNNDGNFAFNNNNDNNNGHNNNNKQTNSNNLSSASISFSNNGGGLSGVGDGGSSHCDCVSSIFSQRQHHHRVRRRRRRQNNNKKSRYNNNNNNNNNNNGGNNNNNNNNTNNYSSSNNNNNNNNNIHHVDDDYDTQLIKELNELSFEERNKVYEEIHGVAETIQETPDFINTKLEELKVAISKLSRSKRRVLDRAFFLKPTLVEDTKFMLMFLRSDCYNPILAAQRMGKYFDNKLELWGESKLVKDITIEDDLSSDDYDCLKSGTIQLLPSKDQSGRYVWFIAQQHYKYKHWKNQIRYAWYQVMATLEKEEAQIHGIVDIVYCIGLSHMENTFPQMMTEGGHYLTDLPFRIVGLHFCYNDIRLRPALSLVQMICDRQKRLRIKFHYGSNIEAQYALLTFGIPVSVIPMNKDGSLIDEVIYKYIEERKDIEENRRMTQQQQKQQQSNNKNYIEYPNYYDILLGRGRPYQEFTGNQILMNIVENKRQHYQSLTDKFEKTCIAMGIVNKIQNEFGGRFIQRIPNQGWEIVDDLVAREKVSHTFRTKTTKIHNHQKQRGNNNNIAAATISPVLPLSSPSSSSLLNNGLVAVGEQQQQQQRRRQQQQHTQDEDEVLNGGDYDSTLYRKNTKRIRI